MSQTQAAPQITGKMFLFEKPELLNRENHSDLGLDPAKKPFAFCAKIRAVPLTISEMTEACKHYPIVFHSKEQPLPMAILGLGTDVNLFVDDDGNWDRNAYIPGYLRRYPFALAAETGSDRLALVFDTAYEGLSKNSARKLFEGAELSEFAKQALEFARTYEGDRRGTEEAFAALKKYDLVHPQAVQYSAAGSSDPSTLAQYVGIDESKLTALSDEQFLEIRRTGLLPVIYAQLMSMANWRQLISRRMQRFGMTEAEAIKPPQLS